MVRSIDTSCGNLYAADQNHALIELTGTETPATKFIYFAKYHGDDLEVVIDADASDVLTDSPVIPTQRFKKAYLWAVVNKETSCEVYCVRQPGNKVQYDKVATLEGFHAESIGCSITSAIFLVGDSGAAFGKIVAFEYGKADELKVHDVKVAVASTSGHGMAFEAKDEFSGKSHIYYVTDNGERWILYSDAITDNTNVDVVTVEKDTYKNRLELKSRFYGDFLLVSSVDEDDISQTLNAVLDLMSGVNLLQKDRAPRHDKVAYEVDTFEGMMCAKVVGSDDRYIYHHTKWHGPFCDLGSFLYGVVGFTKFGTCSLIYYER